MECGGLPPPSLRPEQGGGKPPHSKGTSFEQAPRMTRPMPLIAVLLFSAAFAHADWENVGPGVDYQEFRRDKMDVHVTRVDLANDQIAVVGTRESDKGTRVSDFGKKYKALAAINGDYFD